MPEARVDVHPAGEPLVGQQFIGLDQHRVVGHLVRVGHQQQDRQLVRFRVLQRRLEAGVRDQLFRLAPVLDHVVEVIDGRLRLARRLLDEQLDVVVHRPGEHLAVLVEQQQRRHDRNLVLRLQRLVLLLVHVVLLGLLQELGLEEQDVLVGPFREQVGLQHVLVELLGPGVPVGAGRVGGALGHADLHVRRPLGRLGQRAGRQHGQQGHGEDGEAAVRHRVIHESGTSRGRGVQPGKALIGNRRGKRQNVGDFPQYIRTSRRGNPFPAPTSRIRILPIGR